MKYNVGDLLLIKRCVFKYRNRLRAHVNLYTRLPIRFKLHLDIELFNSYGIITEAIKHTDAWEGDSTNGDNVYVWFSQVDGKEHYFYENEVTGEVIDEIQRW